MDNLVDNPVWIVTLTEGYDGPQSVGPFTSRNEALDWCVSKDFMDHVNDYVLTDNVWITRLTEKWA